MKYNYPPSSYRVSAKAVIAYQKKILLIKEKSEHWDLPGGGVEHFEEIEDALRRELREEIGAEISSINENRVQPWMTYDMDKDWAKPILYLVYPVTIFSIPSVSMGKAGFLNWYSLKELETVSLEKYIEKFRVNLINMSICITRNQ